MKHTIFVFAFSLLSTEVHAFTETEARACVQVGIDQAKQIGDLQPFINAQVHIDSLAAQAVWGAWRVNWDNLSDAERNIARVATESYLTDVDALSDINRDTISLDRPGTEKLLKSGVIQVDGYFETTSGKREIFSIRVSAGCYIVDADWQNIRLSNRIAGKLR
ncbi:MAG: hypothetical protein ACI9SY_000753 [Candidatus Paceibacteria bacterium]|jgi:hypothetical protein